MCGIFGLVGIRFVEVDRAHAHRGPDDEGTELLPLASEPGAFGTHGQDRPAMGIGELHPTWRASLVAGTVRGKRLA